MYPKREIYLVRATLPDIASGAAFQHHDYGANASTWVGDIAAGSVGGTFEWMAGPYVAKAP